MKITKQEQEFILKINDMDMKQRDKTTIEERKRYCLITLENSGYVFSEFKKDETSGNYFIGITISDNVFVETLDSMFVKMLDEYVDYEGE